MSNDDHLSQDRIEDDRVEATTIQERAQGDQDMDRLNDLSRQKRQANDLLEQEIQLLEQEIQLVRQETQLLRQETQLLRQERLERLEINRLHEGTFFSTISQVLRTEHQELRRFRDHANFVRLSHVNYDIRNFYENTVDAARKSNAEAATTFVSSRAEGEIFDIFGVRNVRAHSAHLLPHASSYAPYWFLVVPWVLFTGTVDVSWKFLQNCIHGSITSTETVGSAKSERKKKATDINQKLDRSNSSWKHRLRSFVTSKKTVGSAKRKDVKKKPTDVNQKSDRSNSSGSTKQQHIGIKHFPTNRIRLVAQATYFDLYPCVIIVPILEIEDVRSWNGGAYNAIVLAGDWEQMGIVAADVYRDINATRNMLIPITDATGKIKEVINNDCLASEAECRLACHLLRQMTLCVCKSVKGRFTALRQEIETWATGDQKYQDWKSAVNRLSTAPVPIFNNYSTETKVRKISFNMSTEEMNPAPDPLLLLAKATSNWLKRHQIEILPTCDENDSSSDFISISEEFEIRGWPPVILTEKQPHIAEVDIHIKSDTFDEPLTDDES